MEVAMEGSMAIGVGIDAGASDMAAGGVSMESTPMASASSGLGSVVRPKGHYLFEGVRMTMMYRVWVAAHKRLSEQDIQDISEAIDDAFNGVDEGYNCYNPTSELAAINRANADHPIALSTEMGVFLCGPVKHAVEWSAGLYDPTVRPLLQLWKLRVTQGEEPSDAEIERLSKLVGFDKIKFGGNVDNPRMGGVTLTKTVRGIQLDLCGIAKGLAVDEVVNNLRELGHYNVYVDWGGDIRSTGSHSSRAWTAALAYPKPLPEMVEHSRQSRNKSTTVTVKTAGGSTPLSCAAQARQAERETGGNRAPPLPAVAVGSAGGDHRHDREADSTTAGGGKLKGEKYLGFLHMNGLAMATSGDYENVWVTHKKMGESGPTKKHVYSHIVIPTTGKCIEPGDGKVASVSVLSRHCCYADGVATGAIAKGDIHDSSAWLDQVIETSNGEIVGYCVVARGTGEVIISPTFRALML